ncbi:hypothetical protein ACJCHP_004687 [Enterobacter asburiae]
MSTPLFSKTPTVTVLDNRGLPVRELQYYRHPDQLNVSPGISTMPAAF